MIGSLACFCHVLQPLGNLADPSATERLPTWAMLASAGSQTGLSQQPSTITAPLTFRDRAHIYSNDWLAAAATFTSEFVESPPPPIDCFDCMYPASFQAHVFLGDDQQYYLRQLLGCLHSGSVVCLFCWVN